MDKLSLRALAVCFVAGGLLVLAFAPFNFYILAFISLAILFYLWAKGAPKTNFYLGLSFGLGLYCFGVSWVYVSLSTYGGMPLWMGSIAVLGFAALLSLFVAIPGYLVARLFRKNVLFAIPFIWVLFEWAKSWVLTGFPWLDVGYTQTPSWLFAWAPVGGVYLVSFTVVAISAVLAMIARYLMLSPLSNKQKRIKVIALVTFIGVSVFSSFVLSSVEWSQPVGRQIQVGIVQPNTPIEEKWKASYQTDLICLLYTSPSPRDLSTSRMPSSA